MSYSNFKICFKKPDFSKKGSKSVLIFFLFLLEQKAILKKGPKSVKPNLKKPNMKNIIIMKKIATKANKVKFNFSTTSHVDGLSIEQNIKNGTIQGGSRYFSSIKR